MKVKPAKSMQDRIAEYHSTLDTATRRVAEQARAEGRAREASPVVSRVDPSIKAQARNEFRRRTCRGCKEPFDPGARDDQWCDACEEAIE